MTTESSKVTLGEFLNGLTVFQTLTCLALAITTVLALWSWRDRLVSEKAILQAHLIQAEARSNTLVVSLKRTENTVQRLEETSQVLRSDLAKRSTTSSRNVTCVFIQKEIASVKADLTQASEPLVVFGETSTDREERSKHLARLDRQLRTLTATLEACAR